MLLIDIEERVKQRYLNDATFRHLVDSLRLLLLDQTINVSGLTDAVILATHLSIEELLRKKGKHHG